MSAPHSSALTLYEAQVAKLWLQRSELKLTMATMSPEELTAQQQRALAALDEALTDAEERVAKAKLDAFPTAAAAQATARPSFASKDYFRPPDLDKNPQFRCNPELPSFPLAQYLHSIGTDLMSLGGYTISDLPRCLVVCLSQCSLTTRTWYLNQVLPQAMKLSADGRTEFAWQFCKDSLLTKFPQPDQHLVYSTALFNASQGDQTIQAFNNWWVDTVALAGLDLDNPSLFPMYLAALSPAYRTALSKHMDTLTVQDVSLAAASQTLKLAMQTTHNLSHTGDFQASLLPASKLAPRQPRPPRAPPSAIAGPSLQASARITCFRCGDLGHTARHCLVPDVQGTKPHMPLLTRPSPVPIATPLAPAPAPPMPSPAPFAARPPRTPMASVAPRANLFATPPARPLLTPATPAFSVQGVPVRRVVLEDGTECWMAEHQLQEPAAPAEAPDPPVDDDEDDLEPDDSLAASLGDMHLRPP